MSKLLQSDMLFALLWILVGLALLIAGIYTMIKQNKKKTVCTSKTYGRVIDIVEHVNHDSDGISVTRHPVFEYNIGGENIAEEHPYGRTHSNYNIGQEVEIYYNPENYHEHYIGGDNTPKIQSIILLISGVATVVLGVVLGILIANS